MSRPIICSGVCMNFNSVASRLTCCKRNLFDLTTVSGASAIVDSVDLVTKLAGQGHRDDMLLSDLRSAFIVPCSTDGMMITGWSWWQKKPIAACDVNSG